jgi:predicted secreted acid phosphatase
MPFLFGLTLTAVVDTKATSQVHTIAEVYSLPYVKQQLAAYYDSGVYISEIAEVIEPGKQYLEQRAKTGSNLAVVFDIDETSLSNWDEIQSLLLVMSLGADIKNVGLSSSDPPIQPTLDLYRLARQKGYQVFFITGRSDTPTNRRITEENLRKAGYKNWKALYLKPVTYNQPSVVPYKSGVRKKITETGSRIVLSVGDQYSDLEGGYAERTLKLPNPFYFIP